MLNLIKLVRVSLKVMIISLYPMKIVWADPYEASRSELYEGIKKGDLKKVKEIITQYPFLKSESLNHGVLPLHAVISGKNQEMLQLFIDQGASLDQLDHQGNSVLHHAIENGNIYAVKMLAPILRKKKMFKILNHRNDFGERPLRVIGKKYDEKDIEKAKMYEQMAAAIIDNYVPNKVYQPNTDLGFFKAEILKEKKDYEKDSADKITLFSLIDQNKLEEIKKLLKENPSIKFAVNRNGYNAVGAAIENNKPDLIEFLVQNNFNLNLANNKGENILHIALRKKNVQALQIIANKMKELDLKQMFLQKNNNHHTVKEEALLQLTDKVDLIDVSFELLRIIDLLENKGLHQGMDEEFLKELFLDQKKELIVKKSLNHTNEKNATQVIQKILQQNKINQSLEKVSGPQKSPQCLEIETKK